MVAACSYEARKFGVHSAMPMARALRQCPDLVIVRPDFTKYRDVSQQVMAILRSVTPLVEPLSLDEAYLDVTENSLHEPLAMEVAKHLKRRILEETSLTASAGVAPNKFLAKIASGWNKPDGLTVIAPERMEAFLQKLPVEALWGVGPVTAKKLRAIGIEKLVDVRAADEEKLRRTVGSLADWLQAPLARRRPANGDARPAVEIHLGRGHLSRGPHGHEGDARRDRAAGAARRRLGGEEGPFRAHRDHQGALRELHHRHAQPHRGAGDAGRRDNLPTARSRCSSAPKRASVRCVCSALECTDSAISAISHAERDLLAAADLPQPRVPD